MSAAEWTALEQYEKEFNIRQVTGDQSPGEVLSPGPVDGTGLNAPSTSGDLDGVSGTLTADGQKVFSYLNASAPVTFGAPLATTGTTTFGYQATPISTTDFDTLLSGPGGSSLVGIFTHPDGVQELVETYAQNSGLVQDQLLRHGVIAWATRGVYFGNQANYVEMDIDDTFTPDDAWDTATHQIDYSDADALRMQPSDVVSATSWEATHGFRMDQLFNMGGTAAYQADNGGSDPLLAEFQTNCTSNCGPGNAGEGKPYADSFGWISHTYDTPYLDVGCATENYIEAELNENTSVAAGGHTTAGTGGLGLAETSDPTVALGAENPHVFVPGNHSGFANLVPGNPATVDPPNLNSPTVATDASSTLLAGTYEYAVTDQFVNGSGDGQSAADVTAPITVTAGQIGHAHVGVDLPCRGLRHLPRLQRDRGGDLRVHMDVAESGRSAGLSVRHDLDAVLGHAARQQLYRPDRWLEDQRCRWRGDRADLHGRRYRQHHGPGRRVHAADDRERRRDAMGAEPVLHLGARGGWDHRGRR